MSPLHETRTVENIVIPEYFCRESSDFAALNITGSPTHENQHEHSEITKSTSYEVC